MKYQVANFIINADKDVMETARDLLSAAVADAGFEAFEESVNGVVGYVQKDLFDRNVLDSVLSEEIMPGVKVTYTIADAEDKDWNEKWEKAGFDPIDIDGKCTICDISRKEAETGYDNPNTIFIEAKQAFGTGTHETTRMIVSELFDMNLDGKKVLDCGCGTGILSIAALKAGAESATAYDIDEWSVRNTRHNAELNGVTDKIKVMDGDASLLDNVNESFDIILANINRNILLADMDKFCKVMHKSSYLILSGFYVEDIPMLKKKAENLGLKEEKNKHDGQWACLILKA